MSNLFNFKIFLFLCIASMVACSPEYPKFNFSGIQEFKELTDARNKNRDQIDKSEFNIEEKAKLRGSLDSVYFERISEILKDRSTSIDAEVITDSMKLQRMNELKLNYEKYKLPYSGPKEIDEKIANIIQGMVAKIAVYQHEVAWGQRRKILWESIVHYSAKKFCSAGDRDEKDDFIERKIEILDSIDLSNSGIKKMAYSVNFHKLYAGYFGNVYTVDGKDTWTVSCKINSDVVNVENKCDNCYVEK